MRIMTLTKIAFVMMQVTPPYVTRFYCFLLSLRTRVTTSPLDDKLFTQRHRGLGAHDFYTIHVHFKTEFGIMRCYKILFRSWWVKKQVYTEWWLNLGFETTFSYCVQCVSMICWKAFVPWPLFPINPHVFVHNHDLSRSLANQKRISHHMLVFH